MKGVRNHARRLRNVPDSADNISGDTIDEKLGEDIKSSVFINSENVNSLSLFLIFIILFFMFLGLFLRLLLSFELLCIFVENIPENYYHVQSGLNQSIFNTELLVFIQNFSIITKI